jgi:hypothetical protein
MEINAKWVDTEGSGALTSGFSRRALRENSGFATTDFWISNSLFLFFY